MQFVLHLLIEVAVVGAIAGMGHDQAAQLMQAEVAVGFMGLAAGTVAV